MFLIKNHFQLCDEFIRGTIFLQLFNPLTQFEEKTENIRWHVQEFSQKFLTSVFEFTREVDFVSQQEE